ncbi:MAG: aminotransferase class V-fold PLP-dependent enzyme [Gemmatimonadetes bacterium]|nr:aminotransferase class V-fold PLP-dependent enzyme [Gemmatimonadota bacterium]
MKNAAGPRRSLDPDLEEMRRLAHLAVDGVVDYLAGLGDQAVAAPGSAREFGDLVNEELPEEGRGVEDGVHFFFGRVVPRMTRVNHPRFHAYIPCPSSFPGTVGEILAAGANPFVGSWLGGATVAALELQVLRWIARLVGYPEDAAGILTSGGSGANLIALAAARARFDAAAATSVLQSGRIYLSGEGHASVDKAALVLGFPPEALRHVPVDADYHMRMDALAEMIAADRAAGHQPFFVSANAGTVNTGSVDPLPEIADLCAAEGLWFHVDGAYGGFAAIADEGRRRLAGMERADSLTLDPHKWLFAPMGTGCALVRDTASLEAAFSSHGDYLRDLPQDEVNFLDRGPELSRPGRVLGVWMVIRAAGRRELAYQVEEDLRLARLAADLLVEDPRFELVHRPELSIVVFRSRQRGEEAEADRAARDQALMNATLRDGTLMVSTTNLDGRSAVRMVVMNHRTTEADVRRSVERIRELAE